MIFSSPLVLKKSCIKTLSEVEANPNSSNQHEFNGVIQLKSIFGPDKVKMRAIFSIRGTPISEHADVTWYDARERHPTRSEYRLYFQGNLVMAQARSGDNIIIGFDAAEKLHCIVIKSGMLNKHYENWVANAGAS